MTTATEQQHTDLFAKAHTAGLTALETAHVTAMIVGHPSTPLGTDVDPTKEHWLVPEGPCGFAWVAIKPGTSSFARWLLKSGRGSKAYGGGVQVWVREGGQSVQRKAAYAHAFAEILRESGVRAFANSRLD